VQRQGVACQRPATACQRREAFPERRVQPLHVRRIGVPGVIGGKFTVSYN
jgi:hypothetical protein